MGTNFYYLSINMLDEEEFGKEVDEVKEEEEEEEEEEEDGEKDFFRSGDQEENF